MADLILYDGVCGLCDRLTQFILARDHADHFRFASLQSELAHSLLARYGRDAADLDTVYVVAGHGGAEERLLWKSRAIFQVARSLGGVWALAGLFRLLPTVLTDRVYDFIARRRYRWFGRFETCRLPSPSQRGKFL